jgi:hypothetical protein
LLGCRPAAQVIDLLVLRHGPAMDGVLQAFQLGLEMLHTRLERLDAALPVDAL